MELTLERKNQEDGTLVVAQDEPDGTSTVAFITPAIDEDYWLYRVGLSEGQAVVGFPKFTTIGIGFAVEEDDWNTNLPYTSDAEDIVNHIWVNVGDPTIPRDAVIEAVRLIQAAATEDRATTTPGKE